MLDVCDFTVNPAAPELGALGACQVRFGKAMRGSPPRRRVVATVMPWAAQALQEYLAEVRPQYGCGAHPAIWLTERAARISARQVDDRFAQFRALAGLPGRAIGALPAAFFLLCFRVAIAAIGGQADLRPVLFDYLFLAAAYHGTT